MELLQEGGKTNDKSSPKLYYGGVKPILKLEVYWIYYNYQCPNASSKRRTWK